MKKCIVITLCAILGMGSVSEYRALQKKQISEEFVNMINPFTDSASLEEAERLAGFSIVLPEKIENSTTRIYRSMEQTLLEVIYEDEEKNEIARVRKGIGEPDISGDYNKYSLDRKISVNGVMIEMKGENNSFMLAVWTKNGYSYSVSTNGSSLKKMKELVGGIE